MKYLYLLLLILLLITSCQNEETSEIQGKESVRKTVDKSFAHILTEAYEEQPSIHYTDKNTFCKKRMSLHIELDDEGDMTISGRAALLDDLIIEIQKFYFANRELGAKQSKENQGNKKYKFHNYPFFNYFDRDGFESFLEPLKKMAKTDSMAKIYYDNHKDRILAFEAVEGATTPFIEFGSLISIHFSQNVIEQRVSEVENKVAEVICLSRNEIAEELFGRSYYLIREKAIKNDPEAVNQLVYLQEMIPAYIKKASIENLPALDYPITPPPPEFSDEDIKQMKPEEEVEPLIN